MALSEDLVSQFVDATKDNEKKSKETITYGTIKELDGKTYVLLDGATEEHLTPVYTTANVQADERVTVMIKNHTATVTGNMSSPAARTGDVENLSGEVVVVKELVADTVDTVELKADRAEIGTLIAEDATIKNLVAENAEIKNLKADKAEIEELYAKKATIEELYASKAEIGELDADIAKIDTLIFGSASGNTIQTKFSNSVIAQLGDAQIKDAMIQNVSAGKITAGSINTNFVNIASDDNSLVIKDGTIQISDDNNVRVQIGKDGVNDYSISVWDDAGNLVFSEGGITKDGIKDKIIRNDMVADDANISGGKIDLDSLFEVMNADGSNTLKASKIYYDDKNQTLDVAFKTLTTDTDELKETVNSQGTELEVIQGQISSKIWEQDIKEAIDGSNTELNTKYSTLEQTVNGINATVGAHTTELSKKADGSELTKTNDKVAALELDVTGFKTTVSATYATKGELDGNEKRNLLSNSEKERSPGAGLVGVYVDVRDALKQYIGKTITISFDARTISGGTPGPLNVHSQSVNGITFANSSYEFTLSKTWQRFSFTTTVVDNGVLNTSNKSDVIWFIDKQRYSDNFSIRKIKIELGSTATEWTPANTEYSTLGVNLLVDSEKERTPDDGAVALFVNVKDALQLHVGKSITISFDARTISGGTPGPLNVHSQSVNGITFSTSSNKFTLTTSWQRFSFTSTVVDNGVLSESNRSDIIYFIDANSPRVSKNFSIRKIKIELGSVATEWTPSSVDGVTNRILSAETRIEQTETAITSHANLISENAGKIQEQSSKLTQTATEIRAEFADSGKTATNYIQASADGLMVADNTKSSLGNNVFIDSDSVDVRKGTTTMASFAADTIELGKNSDDAKIKLCNDKATLTSTTGEGTFDVGFGIDTDNFEVTNYSDEKALGRNRLQMYRYTDNGNTNVLSSYVSHTFGSSIRTSVFPFTGGNYPYWTHVTLSSERYHSSKWERRNLIVRPDAIYVNDDIGAGTAFNQGELRPWNEVLHDSSAFQMYESQTIHLKKAISSQPTGVVLVFREINDGSLQNSGIHTYFVPKLLVEEAPGYGHSISWAHYNGSHYVCKYLYINDTYITGNSYNDDSGTLMSPSGITVTNNKVVLWRVYGV